MRATLKTAKDSRIAELVGICKNSAAFVSLINEVMQRLIVRGKWKGSWQRIRLCLNNGCVTFPRTVAAIYDIAMCGYVTPIRNAWWEFLPNEPGPISGTACDRGCPGQQFLDRGFHPTFSDVQPPNKRLRAYITDVADVGKRLHVFGQDQYGNPIRTGTTEGFYMTLADPYVQTDFDVSVVTGVQKDVTVGRVPLYQVDTVSTIQLALGLYEPTETVAEYHRYYMSGLNVHDSSCQCSTVKTVMAIAKLEFIPVANDWDYLFIDNIPAIKEMAMSIRFSEMDDSASKQKALYHEARAIRELNNEKRNYEPDDQITVNMNVYGSAKLSKQRIGRLV